MSAVQTIHFHYNEDNFLIAETDAGGNSQREYFYADAMLVAMMDYSTRPEGALYYVYLDHLGSVVMLTDTNGQIAWQKSALPFGQTTATSNTIDQKLQFPGQYADTETGYFYNYFRDYDPTIGRYIQSDPIGLLSGINTYVYVVNSPLNNFDYWGLEVVYTGRGIIVGGGDVIFGVSRVHLEVNTPVNEYGGYTTFDVDANLIGLAAGLTPVGATSFDFTIVDSNSDMSNIRQFDDQLVTLRGGNFSIGSGFSIGPLMVGDLGVGINNSAVEGLDIGLVAQRGQSKVSNLRLKKALVCSPNTCCQ